MSIGSLKLVALLVSISLIGVISLRLPQESVGLSSFTTKSDILGSSPSSAEQFLNISTAIGIYIYLLSAWMVNTK